MSLCSGANSASVDLGGLNAEVYPAPGTTDTVGGYLGNVSGSLSTGGLLGACSFTFSGTIGQGDDRVTYSNDTGLLEIPVGVSSMLIVGSTSIGCTGLVNPGDVLAFSAGYDILPPITILPFTG